MPCLRDWWTDDPSDPGRLSLGDERVQELLDRIAPGETVKDLGGTFSLNMHLIQSNRVLRIHRPMISRKRLLAEQQLRRQLGERGVRTPIPFSIDGSTALRVGHGNQIRLAEIEPFMDTVKPDPSLNSYDWLFRELGRLHIALAALPAEMPRSVVATWGTPRSMQRWLNATRNHLPPRSEAREIVDATQSLITVIHERWRDLNHMQRHIVHGDFRLGNAVYTRDTGEPVVFDVGFACVRPRVWDVAYALAFMFLALGEQCTTDTTQKMLASYEDAREKTLSADEHAIIPGMAAIALLHTVAHAGYMTNATTAILSQRSFLDAALRILVL